MLVKIGYFQILNKYASKKGCHTMQHECKITVLETKCFPEYQEKYLADPKWGACPFNGFLRANHCKSRAIDV